jgi:aminoacrylate hydrolase
MDAHQGELDRAVGDAAQTLSPAAVQIARIDMLLAHDAEQQVQAISAPTLVIGAVDDALLPFVYSERIAARISGARLAKVKGGHFHPRTEPEQFATLVQSFLHVLMI